MASCKLTNSRGVNLDDVYLSLTSVWNLNKIAIQAVSATSLETLIEGRKISGLVAYIRHLVLMLEAVEHDKKEYIIPLCETGEYDLKQNLWLKTAFIQYHNLLVRYVQSVVGSVGPDIMKMVRGERDVDTDGTFTIHNQLDRTVDCCLPKQWSCSGIDNLADVQQYIFMYGLHDLLIKNLSYFFYFI